MRAVIQQNAVFPLRNSPDHLRQHHWEVRSRGLLGQYVVVVQVENMWYSRRTSKYRHNFLADRILRNHNGHTTDCHATRVNFNQRRYMDRLQKKTRTSFQVEFGMNE